MLGRGLTSVVLGLIADRNGGKPVIVFGIVSAWVLRVSLFIIVKLNSNRELDSPWLSIDMIFGLLHVHKFVSNTLFGLTMHYSMALTARFLLCALNGLLGPVRVWWLCHLDLFGYTQVS